MSAADPRESYELVVDSETAIEGHPEWGAYRCKACGGVEFRVWSHEWKTAIACKNCGIPAVIHEG